MVRPPVIFDPRINGVPGPTGHPTWVVAIDHGTDTIHVQAGSRTAAMLIAQEFVLDGHPTTALRVT